MMRRYLIVFLSCFALIVSSCKKEYSCEDCKPVKYLASFIILGNNDTTPVFAQEFDYDGQHRVVEFREGNTSADGKIIEQKIKYRFYYEGAYPQPYRADYFPFPVLYPNFSIPVYFQYDQLGWKISDSVIFTPLSGTTMHTQALNYFRSGNTMLSALSPYTPSVNVAEDTIQFNGQNIAQHNIYGAVSRYQYDSKINPYAQINIATSHFAQNPTVSKISTIFLHYSYIGLNKNNRTEIDNVTYAYKIHLNYNYDSDGYPLSVSFGFPGSPDANIAYYKYLP